jgi:hypothetical protein
MKFDDAAWARWQGWITTIKKDLSGTITDHAMSRTFRRVVRENDAWIDEHKGSRFCAFVVRSYVVRAAFGIRRHVKSKDDSISLSRFLEQLEACAPQIHVRLLFEAIPFGSEWTGVAARHVPASLERWPGRFAQGCR